MKSFFLIIIPIFCFAHERLSDWNIITHHFPLTLNEDFIPYQVNSPLWSGSAIKNRWISVPNGQKITINQQGKWLFPQGTILVKNFATPRRNLETRVMQFQNGRWQFYSYKWQGNRRARLISSTHRETIQIDGVEHRWTFPSRTSCNFCHNNRSLGGSTWQLNFEDQLDHFIQQGILQEISQEERQKKLYSIHDPHASITQKARSYLHVNCSSCHSPEGRMNRLMDLSYQTEIEDTDTINVRSFSGSGGAIYRIAPGSASQSVLWQRLQEESMPPISPRVDTEGVQLVRDFINAL